MIERETGGRRLLTKKTRKAGGRGRLYGTTGTRERNGLTKKLKKNRGRAGGTGRNARMFQPVKYAL